MKTDPSYSSSTSTNPTVTNYGDVSLRSGSATLKSTKILPSAYRRELSSNMSYDETKSMTMANISYHPAATAPAVTETTPHSDQFSKMLANNCGSGSGGNLASKPCPPDNLHLMSQNNTQPKYNSCSTPVKHLVPIKTPSTTELPHYDDLTPRGKAAALLGTDTNIPHPHKSKLTDKFDAARCIDYAHAHQAYGHQRSTTIATAATAVPHTNSRRNSDPSSNKISLLEVNRGNDMYQSSTHINIAGHRFHKAGRIGKGEKCASCQENDAFVNEGHRCLDCKLLVHTKCIQNGGVKTLHCEAKRSKRQLRKNFDKSAAAAATTAAPARNSKYSGTREYTDSADKIISDAKELQLMQDFIAQKIYKMDMVCEKPSAVDRVFKQALREFKDNLVAQYSIAHKQKSDTLNIKYRDLISNFEQVMETCCGNKKDDFPLTMGVNAFRGFMNEFMSSRETEKPKTKRKKEKKRKIDEHTSYNGKWSWPTHHPPPSHVLPTLFSFHSY